MRRRTHRPERLAALPHACAALVLVCAGSALPCPAASRPAERGEHGMAVTVDGHATRAALATLRDGGNAVDAAVSAAFVLAVTYPAAGNLGGGGFLLYRSGDGVVEALDFRETAPAALHPGLFLDRDGRPLPGSNTSGGLAVGVPGTVAGLGEAHRRWGTLPWPDLLEPAVRLAEEGFVLSEWMERTLSDRAADLAADAASRAIFAKDGAPPRAGERLVQRDLGRTLRALAAEGPEAFYRGPVARSIVRSVRAAGGVMTENDLSAYRAVVREPVAGEYRGYRVVSFPPPSSGGVVLLEILAMLERFDLRNGGFGSSLTIHRMVEAEKLAYADRSRWLGDPDFVEVPVGALLDRRYLASRAAAIRDRRARPSRRIRPGKALPPTGGETTHLSVADRDGGAVALTTTLNSLYGAAITAEGTGVLLNNEMGDFALAPGVPNMYGLVEGEANLAGPGKRPLSSMTPTVVELPGPARRPFLVLGSPGGSTIITTVLQVLVNVIDHGMPLQEAVDAPRFHHQWLPDRIEHEPRCFSRDVMRALRKRGHALHLRERALGNVSAIGIARDGSWLGAADPRRNGEAAGY